MYYKRLILGLAQISHPKDVVNPSRRRSAVISKNLVMISESAFGRIPEEILVHVISLLPQRSLLAVAQSTRKLHRLASAELYATVYFEETSSRANGLMRFSAKKALTWEESRTEGEINPGRRHSKIFNLLPFLTTIQHNSLLRSLIATAALEQNEHGQCLNDSSVTPGQKCISLQAELRNIGTLHLALGLYYDIENPVDHPFKSLSLRHTHGVYDIDYLHTFFSIQTLRWLCISDLVWSHSLLRKDDIDRSRTSNITRISFPSSAPSANDLEEFMTWPKELKHFGLEAEPDVRNRQVRRRSLVTLLGSQKDTLEAIFLSGLPAHPLIDYTLNHELRTFTALRQLSIRHEWLPQPIRIQDANAEGPSTWDILPTGLDKLQLEIPIIFDYGDMRWDRSVDQADLKSRHRNIAASLYGIIHSKVTRQLSLEEVAVWYRKRGDPGTTAPGHYMWHIHDHEERTCACLLGGMDEWDALTAAFERCGCKLSRSVSAEPPLLDI